MGKQLNNGLLTPNKGSVIEANRVTFAAAGVPTLVDAGRSGAIASVVRTALGRYTFTLAVPYYAKLIACIPKCSAIAGGLGTFQEARYIEGSYSAAAGTFEIDISADEDAPALVDPTTNTALDLIMVFQRLTNI